MSQQSSQSIPTAQNKASTPLPRLQNKLAVPVAAHLDKGLTTCSSSAPAFTDSQTWRPLLFVSTVRVWLSAFVVNAWQALGLTPISKLIFRTSLEKE